MLHELWQALDALLIAPYRWLGDPSWGWWLGTFVLGLWASLLGEFTLAVLYRANHRRIRQVAVEVNQRHNQSIRALKAGDEKAYKGINKLANEAFGRAFFLQIAMGMSSLWPAFFAVAWLQARFSEIDIPVPLFGFGVNYVAGFIVCYLAARIIFSRLKRHLPFFRQTLALVRRMSPEERMELLDGAKDKPPPQA
jgi:hypothetical protein